MSALPDLTETVERCPICGGTSFEKLPTPGRAIGDIVFGPYMHMFALCRCQCGLEFINPRPSPSLLEQFYGSRIYDCHQMNRSDEASRNACSLLEFIARQGPYSQERRLLDFGCGGGYLLAHALKAGWSALGFDVGEMAIQTCRNNQIPVTNQLADLPPGSFDVIILNHVFEHIADSAGILARLRGLLGPQGKLFIEVPNVRSVRARLSLPVLSRRYGFDERHRAFPIHIWYFSPRTLSQLLRKNGFQPVLVTTRGIGLEELIIQREPDKPAPKVKNRPTDPTNSAGQSKSVIQPAKNALKKLYHGCCLGENVIAVSRVRLD